MALEFLVAVASGIIVAIISEFLHRPPKTPYRPIFEVVHEDITIRRGSVVDQASVEVNEEVRIRRWTFRAQEEGPEPPPPDHRTTLIAGGAIFMTVLAILLVV